MHKMKGQYAETYAGVRVPPAISYISETTEQMSINLLLNICITSGKEDLRAHSPIQRNEERVTLRRV